MARWTVFRARNFNGALHAACSLLQSEVDIIAQISASVLAPPPASAKEHVEDAISTSSAKSAQQILEVHTAEEIFLRVLTVDSRVAELIVLLALIGIGEDCIRLRDLLEPLLCIGCVRPVGMVLHGELAVGGLDVLLARILCYTKYLVVVLLLRHAISVPFPLRRP
ncbi:Uncharacterised protein [uncultured archaeon]|nr:Uncharacterised protein [uncultured archaeon]